jgi:hypothetical protein
MKTLLTISLGLGMRSSSKILRTTQSDAFDPIDVAIYLGNMIAAEAGHQLMHALFRRLREKRRDTHPDLEDPPYRRYVIYGPDGDEVLAEGDVPAERGETGPST